MKFNPVKMDPLKLVEACIEELDTRANADQAKPMSRLALGCLRLDGKKAPPTLCRYLSYDYTFYAMSSDWGDFDNLAAIGAEAAHEWEHVDIREEIISSIEALAWKTFIELNLVNESHQVLRDPIQYLKLDLAGKLFKLPNIGNQNHYLYVGNASDNGEYPVLGLEMKGDLSNETQFWGELDVWVKYPNFAVYLYDQIFDAAVYPDDFVAEMDEIYRKNPELSKNFKNSMELLTGP